MRPRESVARAMSVQRPGALGVFQSHSQSRQLFLAFSLPNDALRQETPPSALSSTWTISAFAVQAAPATRYVVPAAIDSLIPGRAIAAFTCISVIGTRVAPVSPFSQKA